MSKRKGGDGDTVLADRDAPAGEVLSVDTGGDLAPWVKAGVMGALGELRQGSVTYPSVLLDTYAQSIAQLVGPDGSDPSEAQSSVVPDIDLGITDVRTLVTDQLPEPGQVIGRLAPTRQWPALMLAPTAVDVGVAYLRMADGRHVLVTVARRRVTPRQRKPAA